MSTSGIRSAVFRATQETLAIGDFKVIGIAEITAYAPADITAITRKKAEWEDTWQQEKDTGDAQQYLSIHNCNYGVK